MIRNFFKRMRFVYYAINACAIPRIDASIITHFQQYDLFIFV